MTPNEQVQMMKRCVHEFQLLRAQISIMKPKAEAYDLIATIADLLPKHSQGYSEDIVWMLENKIGEILKMREESEEGPKGTSTRDPL